MATKVNQTQAVNETASEKKQFDCVLNWNNPILGNSFVSFKDEKTRDLFLKARNQFDNASDETKWKFAISLLKLGKAPSLWVREVDEGRVKSISEDSIMDLLDIFNT